MSLIDDDELVFDGLKDPLTRRQVLQRLGAGGAALALPGFLAACGSGGGTVVAGVAGKASNAEIASLTWASTPGSSLDVAVGFDAPSLLVQALGLEGVVGLTSDLKLKPLLAESWSQPDLKRYVYKLRQGVTFWDGTPVTAEDVAFSLARHIDPKVASVLASYYANVKSVEVSGPNEVTVHMTTPDPVFQFVPVFSWVTPKKLTQQLGKQLGVSGPKVNTMGTGPYRITSFSSSTGATVERNETYWGAKPKVRKATIKSITNPQTTRLAMQSGDVDGTFGYSLDLAKQYDRLPDVNTQYPPGLFIVYLSFDLESAPWSDIHVRRAVAYATDKAGYIKAFLDGDAEPAESIVPKAQWASLASPSEVDAIYAKIPTYPFSIAKAKAELAQSSHPNGFKAEIAYPNSATAAGKALVSLSQTLKQLNIDLTVKEVTSDAWAAILFGHATPFLMSDAGADYPDPADFLTTGYLSKNAVKNNFNTANFKNPTVDSLLDQQALTTDKAKRAQLLGQVVRISGEQLPYLPLWVAPIPIALNKKFVYPGYNSLYYYTPWLAQIGARA